MNRVEPVSVSSDASGWRSWPRRALVTGVRAYRLILSPWLGNACRFEPTCSVYAIGALERHGAFAGSAMALGRIGRCHPWCAGGHDPVPTQPPRLFRALLAPRAGRVPTPSAGASDAASS